MGQMLAKDWGTLLVAVLGIVAGLYATRVSREATKTSREANQIKWVDEARRDSESAKRELREVKKEADEAHERMSETRRELAAAERRLTEATDVIEELSRWATRVMVWNADDSIDRAELKRLINGGPAYLRAGRPPE